MVNWNGVRKWRIREEFYKERSNTYGNRGECMSGVTKHIYEHELRNIVSMWSGELKSVRDILPQYYIDKDIINALISTCIINAKIKI